MGITIFFFSQYEFSAQAG